MTISTIIPIYNEESTIRQFQQSIACLDGTCEIIFVDGGSTDATLKYIHPKYQVLHAKKGRANQQNYGAENSTGDILFFLHCDSVIPNDTTKQIRTVMEQYEVGCFGIAFCSNNIWMKCCQIISNHRIKDRQIMFGDQGIFIKRKLFFQIGGFMDLPIMEDYQLSLTLKEMGIKIGIAKKRIYTSDRRFVKNGRLQVMWQMNRLRAKYREGVNAQTISDMYEDIR
ncbi:MAG: TIGR04283 family arsenosugar biosynthesis glycosyltransferase [Lachnospiraceae bacterium]